MRKVAFIPICTLTLCASVQAAHKAWLAIGTFAMPDGGRMSILLDGRGPTRHGEFWTATQKILFTRARKTPSGASYRSELDVYAYDCGANRAALVSSERWYAGEDLTGTVVDKTQHASPDDYQWADVSAGSVLEAAKKTICGIAGLEGKT